MQENRRMYKKEYLLKKVCNHFLRGGFTIIATGVNPPNGKLLNLTCMDVHNLPTKSETIQVSLHYFLLSAIQQHRTKA
jgi:hypothetical protein